MKYLPLIIKQLDLKKLAYLLGLSVLVFACEQKNETIEHGTEVEVVENTFDWAKIKADADSISVYAQSTLMKNVAMAIEKGGTEFAVEFCNTKAIPLTDSVAGSHHAMIQRITDRNRNPENNLKTDLDKSIFAAFSESQSLKDSLVDDSGHYVYYKRINLAMPTCVKCHGNPESDIEINTYTKIKTLYPSDLATGYAQGDFRGLWKISIEK